MPDNLLTIGFVGSREFTDERLAEAVIVKCFEQFGPFWLVSGGARGADSICERMWRRQHPFFMERTDPIIHYPDSAEAYEAFGQVFRDRAFGRNAWIVRDSAKLVAFFVTPEPSGGTLNTVNHARKKGIPIYRHHPQGWVTENV